MQFTTAKKRQLTIKQAEKFVSGFQIEMEETAYQYLKVKKLMTVGHLIDFDPSVIPFLSPLFVTEDAIDFLIKNHTQITGKLTISNFIEYGRIYKHVFNIFKLNPIDLKQLKENYTRIKPA